MKKLSELVIKGTEVITIKTLRAWAIERVKDVRRRIIAPRNDEEVIHTAVITGIYDYLMEMFELSEDDLK